jgi:hypothetical protein
MKMDVESMLVGLVESRQWPMVAAALIWMVVRALKSERIPLDVPARARPWVALGLGVIAGACESVLGGVPLGDALLAGLGAGLAASGLHESLVESLRHGREPLSIPPPALVDAPRESRRPPPRSDDDDDMPKAPPKIVTLSIVVLWVAACSGIAGCGMSPVSSAIVVANASRDAGEVAREELETRCVEGYRAAGDLADVARLDATCLPLRDAYRGLRGAHLALVTAIQVAQVRGDVAALGAAVAATVQASELVADAVAGGAR